MDDINVLHALKDAAIEIVDLNSRVSALENKLDKIMNINDDICDCPKCECSCNYYI